MEKTNALRFLTQKKIPFEHFTYSTDCTDGMGIADLLSQPYNLVFKTLVTVANTREHLVFVVPVDKTLDLKKAAKCAGVKSVEMIKQKELLPLTGYVHGGCSPVGMKKQFRTFIHESIQNEDVFFVSAGKVGMQMKINPKALANLINATFVSIVAD